MSLIRSARTFVRIAKRNPRQAWELSQLRFENRLGFSLHWIDGLRRTIRSFEVAHTEPVQPHLEAYGNYYLDPAYLPDKPNVFSIGVGEDIDFDRALIEGHPAELHLFDPTPRSERYIAGAGLPDNVRFDRLAISDQDGEIELFIDDLESNLESTTSVSIIDRGHAPHGFVVPCRRVATLMRERGVEHLDVLKLDVEGAAIAILDDVLDSGILPGQIAAEFERPPRAGDVSAYLERIDRLFRRLDVHGYRIFRTRPDCKGFQVEILAVRERGGDPGAVASADAAGR